ncbi:PepSY domain-containing protein [Nocardia wallacei]|uniref:PepSY domain-containing protein n=1 Tax=Nocardia wallacei TaxID=480035 RepID=UPI0024553935|nr:PepSY domain-containing protein [Nocardia wallacei]
MTSAVAAAKSTAVANALAASDTAANAVPDGKPFDLETELQGTEGVFDTKVAAGGNQIDVTVDATGQHIRSQQQSPNPSDDIAELDGVTVTAADALRAASSREPTAEFDELEIDTDDTGAVVWKVDLVRGDHSDITYTVDPHDGHIIGSGSRWRLRE